VSIGTLSIEHWLLSLAAVLLIQAPRQKFNDAIPAGLPPGTPVAHKTGSITRINHDAAIVFAARPYILVLLVRGMEDQKKSAALMAQLSRVVYDATAR
jgi:beta-lactamase class A